jgi:hypothetical protein
LAASVSIKISPGELIDKITILEIKLERIKESGKLENVEREHEILTASRNGTLDTSVELDGLTAELKTVNERLWDIEDDIRQCERTKVFAEKFIELARSVYRVNDERSRLKREINELLGSVLIEEKSYAAY